MTSKIEPRDKSRRVEYGKVCVEGDYDWSPRPTDLTPLDIYLWGYLTSKVYIDKPRTLAQLKTNIESEIAAIPRAIRKKVIENALKRAHYVKIGRIFIRNIKYLVGFTK